MRFPIDAETARIIDQAIKITNGRNDQIDDGVIAAFVVREGHPQIVSASVDRSGDDLGLVVESGMNNPRTHALLHSLMQRMQATLVADHVTA